MRKTNGLCVMLGTTCTWTARTLDVFLELKPRSTPPAVLSCDSWSRPSCILWEDLFSFFCIPFSRPLLKDKPRPRKGRMTDHLYLSASPLLKTTQALFGKKNKILIKLDREAKKRFAFGKNGSSRSDGIVEGLFLSRAWFYSQLMFTCQRKRMLRCRPGCTCKMFPIGFLLFVPVFIPWCSVKMIEDRRQKTERGPEGLRGRGFDSVENVFFFCPIEEKWKKRRNY